MLAGKPCVWAGEAPTSPACECAGSNTKRPRLKTATLPLRPTRYRRTSDSPFFMKQRVTISRGAGQHIHRTTMSQCVDYLHKRQNVARQSQTKGHKHKTHPARSTRCTNRSKAPDRLLALAGLEAAIGFVDDIKTTATAYDTIVAMARAQRLEGISDLHDLLSVLMCRICHQQDSRSECWQMVGTAGIEPATPSMSTRCSPTELRALHKAQNRPNHIKKFTIYRF